MRTTYLLVAILFTIGCLSGCTHSRSGSGNQAKGIPLLKTSQFEDQYQDASRAVAEAIRRGGESPSEFYAEVSTKDEILVFHLWHESAFLPENRNVVGNPGGKCRDVHFHPKTGNILAILFWQ